MSLGSALAPFFGAAGGAGAGAGAPVVEKSLAFSKSNGSYLNRSFGSSWTDKRKQTYSFWFKRAILGGAQILVNGYDGVANFSGVVRIESDDTLRFYLGGSVDNSIRTVQFFRDPTAWYHVVIQVDTTQATAADRYALWVNGKRITAFSAANYPSQNDVSQFPANGSQNRIAASAGGTTGSYDGYLADFYFIDGQSLPPSYFAETNATTGAWEPKAFTAGAATVNDGTIFSNLAGALGSAAYDGSTTTSFSATSGSYYYIASSLEVTSSLRVFIRLDEQWQYNSSETTNFNFPRASSLSYGWLDVTEAAVAAGRTVIGTQTLPRIRVTSGNSPIYAIEVDGVIMQNGVTTSTSYGNYGFHLLFDDNSSSAALGIDSSGNGLDWGVNNLIPITDSPYYSKYITGTNTFYRNQNAFNGSVANYAGIQGSNSTETWTFTYTFNGVTSLRVYTSATTSLSINGGGYSACTDNAWTDFTGSIPGNGQITSLAFRSTSPYTSNFPRIHAIEINNEILTQPSTSSANFDSPSIGTQTDTGRGGQVSGNYGTWSDIDKGSGVYPANFNTDVYVYTTGVNATIAIPSSHKTYFEITYLDWVSDADTYAGLMCLDNIQDVRDLTSSAGARLFVRANAGVIINDTTSTATGQFNQGDILGVAVDGPSNSVQFYRNGVAIGTAQTPSVTINGSNWAPWCGCSDANGAGFQLNTGQRAFTYPVSGYKSLCASSFEEPTILFPEQNFDIRLWTGLGSSSLAVFGYDHDPGIVWMKNRGTTVTNHAIFDRIRDAANQFKEYLSPNNNLTETATDGALEQWFSGGFLMANGATVKIFNLQDEPYVGWSWYSGSTTVNNTDGAIPAEVRANVSAGISTVVYTGTSSPSDVGHGLGAAPDWVIVKPRNINGDWINFHRGFGYAYNTYFNQTLGRTASSNFPSPPDATKLYLSGSSEVNGNTSSYVAYCFVPVTGFSKFGTYYGNGDANGRFVYTGFRPRWILCKSQYVAAWYLFDSERDGYNVDNDPLYPNLDIGEQQDNILDFCSNGFKFRRSTEPNNGGNTWYEYMAFAESPFKYARAR